MGVALRPSLTIEDKHTYVSSEWPGRWEASYILPFDNRLELCMPLTDYEVEAMGLALRPQIADTSKGYMLRKYLVTLCLTNPLLRIKNSGTPAYWNQKGWYMHLRELPRTTFAGRERLFRVQLQSHPGTLG